MNINKTVLKELNSFEISELSRILETLEYQVLYMNGLSKTTGAYAVAEAYGLAQHTYGYMTMILDDIEIEVEYGEQNSKTSKHSHSHIISRKVVRDHRMSLKEKLEAIK